MKKPNILLLVSDHHRGDWMPYPDDIQDKIENPQLPFMMPVLKELMEQGTAFYRAITPSPLCAPARACLASGMRYENCGVVDNGQDYPTDLPTFYSQLRNAGYNVGGVGKFDLHKNTHDWGLDGWVDSLGVMGFTHAIDNEGKWDGYNSGIESPKGPYFQYLHENGMINIHTSDFTKRRANREDTSQTDLPEEAYCDNWLTANGIQLLNEFDNEKPFFLQVNFTGPHPPWDITARMKERWDGVDFPQPVEKGERSPDAENSIRQNFAAMIENIDRNIGLILDDLKRSGELDNTIIIYTADHGEMLGDFGKYGKCQPQRGSVSIPMVISGPGVKKNVISDEFIELQDLAATLLDMCSLEVPEKFESLSFKQHLSNPADPGPRTWVYSALWDWKMVMECEYKAWFYDGSEPKLFNIKQDPWEMEDVAGKCPEIVEKMKERLSL
jgi:arylsulfatase